MNWRFFDHDPLTGTTTYFAHDAANKRNVFRHEQNVESVIENNKALANHDDKGWSPSKEWRRVAEIPNVVHLDWITKHGVDPMAKGNEKLLKRLLNDPDNRFLRTAPGRV